MHVDPAAAEWHRDLVEDPAYPMDARLGGYHVYINGELATSIFPATAGPPAPVGPGELARAEQLRAEVARLEARQTLLAGQVGVDERRLQSVQSELVALEARVEGERTRVGEVTRVCDEEIRRARDGCAEEIKQIRENLKVYREGALQERKELAELFENLRTAEVEEARVLARRRVVAQNTMTTQVEEYANLESNALRAALTGAAKPSMADQAERLGVTVPGVGRMLIEVLERIRPEAKAE